MKKTLRKTGAALLITLNIIFLWGCGSMPQEQVQTPAQAQVGNDFVPVSAEQKEQNDIAGIDGEERLKDGLDGLEDDATTDINKTLFYEKADAQNIDRTAADAYFQKLIDDDVFQGGDMELTGLVIEDMDGNGQDDMLLTVLDAEEKPWYGLGSLWIYMNDDAPYCFAEEDCSYRGYFDTFSADIDNDGNAEIAFSAEGSGCGAVGDSYKAVFKYKDHRIEQMELPSDFGEDCDRGLMVTVNQNPEENSYGAYCPYFNETISFDALNAMEPPSSTRIVGGNARGFYDLKCVEYNGQNALQASEYLYGEGGIVHNVATAQFLIVWDENSEARVAEWKIEVLY